MSLHIEENRQPLLCYVTDRHSLSAAESAADSADARLAEPRGAGTTNAGITDKVRQLLLHNVAKAAAAGINLIQIREKDVSGKECAFLVRDALQLAATSAAGEANTARILVNGRLDVAVAMRADGVHLGEKSVSPREARRLAGALHREKDFLIGVSCHSLAAAESAARDGADYLFFGPVFATPSKAAYGVPQGLERLAEVCRAVGLPVLAIGGITLENCAACLYAGAAGIAAIRLFQDAPDVAAVVRTLRKLAA